MKKLGLVLLCLCAAGCVERKERQSFDGQFFSARLSSTRGDRSNFQIAIKPVSASIEGALEAGRYESTRHCVTYYGSSEVDWQIGPDQDPESYAISNDTLLLQGRCVE